MTEFYSLTPEQDDEVEALVDKRGISYDEARRSLGYSAVREVQESSSVKISARAATAPGAHEHAALGPVPEDLVR